MYNKLCKIPGYMCVRACMCVGLSFSLAYHICTLNLMPLASNGLMKPETKVYTAIPNLYKIPITASEFEECVFKDN